MRRHLAAILVAAAVVLVPLHGKDGPKEGPKGPQEAPAPQGPDREPCGESPACNGK